MAIALDFDNGQQLVYEARNTGGDNALALALRIENDTIETLFKGINGEVYQTVREVSSSKLQTLLEQQAVLQISHYLPDSDTEDIRKNC